MTGKTQLTKALQPLVEAAEETLQLASSKRTRTIIHVDAGGGSLDDMNWLLQRGYQVHGKDYSRQRAQLLAQRVECWFDDPQRPDRQVGWITIPASDYVRPVVRIAVRYRQQNGQWTMGALLSTLSASDILQLTAQPLSLLLDPQAVLLAYVADLAISVVGALKHRLKATSRDWA